MEKLDMDILKTATVRKILSSRFKKSTTSIHLKALDQLTKVLNIVVVECSLRSAKQAFVEDTSTVSVDIVQKILPQMILDL